ncbi:unnamed protein product [Blepharisma stoltei]|uniref:Uncharacterized protein n=1 Tax=Blepharisma stoltei TaxID=1481888 RepID=A0AAU9K8J0_9CILI|nr:unnamed protein product [Blepharisma stoltei]
MAENSVFLPSLTSISKNKPADLSMTYKVSNPSKLSLTEKSSATINEDMQTVIHYIDQYYPTKIPIPFRGNSLNLTSDKAYFIICSVEGRLAVINRLTKECINDVQLPGGGLYTTALYKNSEYVLTGGKEGIIRKFKLSTFEEVEQLKGHTDKISEVMFSPDETVLYSGSDDGTVRTWDLVNKSESVIIYTHSSRMLSMDLSIDGEYLVTGGADKLVKVYNTERKEVEAVLNGPTHSVWCVKLTKSKSMIAAGDNDACAYIWEFGTWKLLHKLQGHEKRVANIDFLRND